MELLIGLVFLSVVYYLCRTDRRSPIYQLTVDGNLVPESRILIPASWVQKRVGLLNHALLAPKTGILLRSCRAVHTQGMATPIDVVILDKKFKVVRLERAMAPGVKKSWGGKGRHHFLELGAGSIDLLGLKEGSTLSLVPFINP